MSADSEQQHDGAGQAHEPAPQVAEPSSDADSNGASGQDEKAKKKPLFKRAGFWIIAAIVVAIIAIGIVLFLRHAAKFESTDDAFVDAHIVRLQPQISGQITWVAPVDDEHVEAGQLLAKIEPTGPQAQLAQSQADVSEADANVQQAEGKLIAARAEVKQAIANANAPEAQAAQAETDYDRYQRLMKLDPNAAASTQVDAARAQARSTSAQAASAREQISSARAQVLVAQKAVAAARAQKQAAQARLDQTKVTVGDLRITAPVDGQVVNRSINVGSTVSPQSELMAIIPERIWVSANFKETQLTHMKRGDPVDIKIDAFPNVDFHGHVESFQRGAGQAFAVLPPQNATGNFVKVVQRVPVRIVFDKRGADPSKYPIGPGMSVVPTVRVAN